jgi:hypothetical protein
LNEAVWEMLQALPELFSRSNIGVNKPNTDGDEPAFF